MDQIKAIVISFRGCNLYILNFLLFAVIHFLPVTLLFIASYIRKFTVYHPVYFPCLIDFSFVNSVITTNNNNNNNAPARFTALFFFPNFPR